MRWGDCKLVARFTEGPMGAQVWRTELDNYVAADQCGWIPGSWSSITEAMQGARAANGLP